MMLKPYEPKRNVKKDAFGRWFWRSLSDWVINFYVLTLHIQNQKRNQCLVVSNAKSTLYRYDMITAVDNSLTSSKDTSFTKFQLSSLWILVQCAHNHQIHPLGERGSKHHPSYHLQRCFCKPPKFSLRSWFAFSAPHCSIMTKNIQQPHLHGAVMGWRLGNQPCD